MMNTKLFKPHYKRPQARILVCIAVLMTFFDSLVTFSAPREVFDSKGNIEKNLVEDDLPQLYSSFVTQNPSTKNQNTPNGLMVLFPGLGAKTKFYGIGASMAPIANKSIKLGWTPFAFQNPLYFRDDLPNEEREALVGHFKSLDKQLHWVSESINFAVNNSVNTERLVLSGRSTGSALILEALHRYLTSNQFADVFSKVQSILIMGPIDPRPDKMQKWLRAEQNFLDTSPHLEDKFANQADPEILKQMKFSHQKVLSSTAKHIPKVYFVLGTNDPITALNDQINFVKYFHENHPQVEIEAIISDTDHNPVTSLNYLDPNAKPVKVGTMKRFSPILEDILKNNSSSVTAGLTFKVKEEALAWHPLCRYLLSRPD